MTNAPTTIAVEGIASRISLMRGQRVIVDVDLVALYGVPTKRLNEQVQRNADRFPADFMFQLTQKEWDALRSLIATLKPARGHNADVEINSSLEPLIFQK